MVPSMTRIAEPIQARIEQLEVAVATLSTKVDKLTGVEPDGLDEDDAELYERLREWRTGIAIQEGFPPFRVLSNRLLAVIASTRPIDRFELLAVKGIGEDKVTKYGSEILGIVNGDGW